MIQFVKLGGGVIVAYPLRNHYLTSKEKKSYVKVAILLT